MTDDLLQKVQKLNVWGKSGKRAPHKPLLALWAIGRCLRGEPRLAPYQLVHQDLERLLLRFGPHRTRHRTDYPFWHMRSDLVWEVDRPELVRTTSANSAFIRDLRRHSIEGGFTREVHGALRSDSSLAARVAESLVASHFPASLRDAVLEATLMPTELSTGRRLRDQEDFEISRRRKRDRAFRNQVLTAYASRCAVCAFAVRLHDAAVALEAAHIRWHESRGPSIVSNGLALCSLHHGLFDAGAFTVLPELKVVVARDIRGEGVDSALGRYHHEALRVPPLYGFPKPDPAFLSWHASEVFKDSLSIS